MFDQIKALMGANGESRKGDDPSLMDHYAGLLDKQLQRMKAALGDAQEAEGELQEQRMETLGEELARLVCGVTAYGYSLGIPMKVAVGQVIRQGEAFEVTPEKNY